MDKEALEKRNGAQRQLIYCFETPRLKIKSPSKLDTVENLCHLYSAYNQKQVDSLKEPSNAGEFKRKFGEKPWEEACMGYQLIADSMQARELLVKEFVCLT